MCGILGIVSFLSEANKVGLKNLSDTLLHRGPDEYGSFQSEKVAFGSRRLAIIDVSGGQQPYFNESRNLVVIFNGQIYNFLELQRVVVSHGHALNSNTDGEVISHLFEIYGPSFVNLLSGMFAIGIWDNNSNELHLFRDRLGKKPLNYMIRENEFIFASEIKAILEHTRNDQCEVSKSAIIHFLTFGYIPNPNTVFSGLFKLKPGHMLHLKNRQVRIAKYWEPTIQKQNIKVPDKLQHIDTLLTNAVSSRLVTERPLGVFLSGGLDSSLVALKAAELTSSPIKSFSIGFDELEFDETNYARQVSKKISSDHHELIIHEAEVPRYFKQMIDAFDEPFGDSSSLATLALAEFAAKEVVVALSGDGGDEIFGGYKRYLYVKKFDSIEKIFSSTSKYLNKIPNLQDSIPIKIQRFMSNKYQDIHINRLYFKMIEQTYGSPLVDILKEEVDYASNPASQFYNLEMSRYGGLNSVQRANLFDLRHYLPDDLLHKVDISSMYHSLEVRSPFLDQNLVEFGSSLPDRERFTKSGKPLLKKYAEKYFPQEFIYRPKMGFGIPKQKWLRGILEDECRGVFLNPHSYIYTIFRFDELSTLYKSFQDSGAHQNIIWNLLVLEKWNERWNPETQ